LIASILVEYVRVFASGDAANKDSKEDSEEELSDQDLGMDEDEDETNFFG
jgi:hypothetical protein